MNMMRKNNNRNNNNMKHRSGGGNGGGGRRYQGGNGGGNRAPNDSGNITRQKHHATQMREKYSNMARDAQNNGDRVDVEYYLQHVDHYTRVLNDIAAIEAERHSHHRQQAAPAGEQGVEHGASAAEPVSGLHGGGEPSATAQSSNEGSQTPAEMMQQSHQPRMTRQPRRQYSDNGAAEANSNTADIPLPDGILPPV